MIRNEKLKAISELRLKSVNPFDLIILLRVASAITGDLQDG